MVVVRDKCHAKEQFENTWDGTDIIVNTGEEFDEHFSEYWHEMFSSIMALIVVKYGWEEVEGVVERETPNMSFEPADFDHTKAGLYTIKLETNIGTIYVVTVDYDTKKFHIVNVDRVWLKKTDGNGNEYELVV